MNRKGKLERQKAYHEAGRAVVARTFGITMSHVTMLSTDDMTAGSALADSASWLARDADQATRLAAIEKDMKACSPARMRRRGISRAKASASQTNGLATLSWQRLCDEGGPDQDRTRSRYPDRRRRLRDCLGSGRSR